MEEEDDVTRVDAPLPKRSVAPFSSPALGAPSEHGDGDALVPPPEPSVPTVAEHAPDDATTLGGDTRREQARPSVPRPTPSRRPPGSADSGASSRSIAESVGKPSILTTGDAIQHQDIDRARSFLRIAVIVCVLVAAPVWWLGGDAWAQRIFFGAMIVCALASAYVAWRLRDARAYTPRRILGIGLVLVAGAFTGIVYTGVFSAAAGVIPFGLFFFGLSRWSPGTLSVYLTCAIGYAVVAGLIAFGAFPDPGIMSSEQLRLGNKLAIIGLAEVFFFATFSVSRRSYRAAAWALEQHEHAVRDLAAREALLKEARLDLEGALRARGLGRFTDEVVGSYRLGTILGRGGMGEVYDAVHCDTEEQAAVKLLHAEVLRDPDGIRRFLRECQAASKLDVPNVVRVIATSEPSAPIPFIAMERLHGDDLADHLRAVGRMELEDVVTLVHQVGAGLDAARAAGIVHRDIKPRNLFRAEQGNGPPLWKILDFGVSKLVSEATLTKKDMVGTPSYMAPEQASGGAVSHRTDLFALGVIAYRALTGRPAFSGDLVPQILYQVVHVMPPRPSLVVRLPGDVDRVLALALAKDPKDRFDSGAEMAQALEAAARRRLAPELRARADELLGRSPWSKS